MVAGAGTVSLHDLVNQNVREILTGSRQPDDRSYAITAVARELYGWENWAMGNGVALIGQADTVIAEVGQMLAVDADRVGRILASVDRATCQPAIVQLGGESAAWKKVKQLNWELYQVACPGDLQQEIRGNLIASLRQVIGR
jgi:hypothetical protein